LAEEQRTSLLLVELTDLPRSPAEGIEATKETPVGGISPADVPGSSPARRAKRVQPAVVTGTGIGVRGDGVLALFR
jgi:hypothetical protein